MANQVAARLSGDDYQHLYAWQLVLELKMPRKSVRLVTVEDALAGSVDDVTVRHQEGTSSPDQFFQVKYHVDQRDEYSTEKLIGHKEGEASLLEKFWRTWNLLQKQNPERSIELHLVSNWSWDGKDKLRKCFDGRDNSVTEDYFFATPNSDIGKLRALWQTVLKAKDEDFKAFIKCLRFKVGFDCSNELEQRVAERMDYLRLKSDPAALLIAVGIVRNWIKSGKQELTIEELEVTLRKHDLYRIENSERSVTVYLTTIKSQKFDIEPDYIIDWRDGFLGDPNKKGHQLKDPAGWNGKLLPEVQQLEATINQETDCRLIKARGLARLSAWFAFGFSFSEVARYTIEVDQNGRLWRTDGRPNSDFEIEITSQNGSPEGEVLDAGGEVVALGISVSGLIDQDVLAFLNNRAEKVASVLLLRPKRDLGRECLRDAGDAVALADHVKKYARAFVKRWNAKRLLLFYFGPLSGACFIGHRLNAVCHEIQIMEDQRPSYAPSFLLK